MDVKGLYEQLRNIASIDACHDYVKNNFTDIAGLFTEISPEDLQQSKFDFEDAFLALDELINTGDELPSSNVTALLLFFASVFERTRMHTNIQRVATVLPDDHRSKRLSAIFRFKSITDTTSEYEERFDRICTLLAEASVDAGERIRSQCEDLTIEYFAVAVLNNMKYAGNMNNWHEKFRQLFSSNKNIARFPLLGGTRLRTVLNLSPEQLVNELKEANIRIAEAFFDEAMTLVPLSVTPLAKDDSPCSATRVYCPDGLHEAKRAIIRKYPDAYSRTDIFVTQSLNSIAYEKFGDDVQCMRYLRQYMPLHIPQLEAAIARALEVMEQESKLIRILDVGSGPGTLYCALSRLISKKLPTTIDRTFEYNPLEPSYDFLEFFDIFVRHIKADGLTVGSRYCSKLNGLTIDALNGINWIFLGNAVTPLIAETNGDVNCAVNNLISKCLLSQSPSLLITLAENSKTADFIKFCDAIDATGQFKRIGNSQDISIDAGWLAGCCFKTKARFTATRPALKLCNFKRC